MAREHSAKRCAPADHLAGLAGAAGSALRRSLCAHGSGVSAAPFDSLNVGARVGDTVAAVTENRRRVRTQLRLPAEPLWLEQVHGIEVADLDMASGQASATPPTADAAIARRAGNVCVMQVADCMPVLFAARDGRGSVAARARRLARAGRGGVGSDGGEARRSPKGAHGLAGPYDRSATLRGGGRGACRLPGARPRRGRRIQRQQPWPLAMRLERARPAAA